jgi:shikimate kinase
MKTLYCITGMKHSGKTTAGKLLAEGVYLPFYDLDSYTEAVYRDGAVPAQTDRGIATKAAGRRPALSCREIYRKFGREGFMAFEAVGAARLLSEATDTGGVCAFGGGSIENPKIIPLFEGRGLFIYIDEKEDVLFERIRRNGIPPFLSGPDPEGAFHELYKRRTRLYEEHADLRIGACGEEPEKIVRRILEKLQEQGENHGRE